MVIAADTFDQYFVTEAGVAGLVWRPRQQVEEVLPRARVLPRLFVSPGATYVFDASAARTPAQADAPAAQPTEERKTAADRAIGQLFRFEKLHSNWDGNNAAQPIAASLSDAKEFIRCLAPESTIPMATLHADGHAVLLLSRANAYAEIEFLGEKRFGYYARQDGQEWGDELLFDGGHLPEGLSEIGFAIGR